MSRRIRGSEALTVAAQIALAMAAPRFIKALPPRVRPGGALLVALFGPFLAAKAARRIR